MAPNSRRVRLLCRAVVRFYNKRGTAEQWIKEGKQAVKLTVMYHFEFRDSSAVGHFHQKTDACRGRHRSANAS
jgi:hypothetical protein